MKAPPTYPNLPVATDDDPNIAGITILSSRDAGSMNEWVFKINRGEEATAINGLLDALQTVCEFSLADHSRDDYESSASYEKDGIGYKMMVGGHGWSGDWKFLDRASAIAAAREQVQYNYGAAWHDCGRIIKRK